MNFPKKAIKQISTLLCALLLLPYIAQPSAHASSQKKGEIYSTSTSAYLLFNSIEMIPLYMHQGSPYIVAEDLSDHGYDVIWHAETSTLEINKNDFKEHLTLDPEALHINFVSKKEFDVIESDAKILLQGEYVPCCDVNGKLLLAFKELQRFGTLEYNPVADSFILYDAEDGAAWINNIKSVIACLNIAYATFISEPSSILAEKINNHFNVYWNIRSGVPTTDENYIFHIDHKILQDLFSRRKYLDQRIKMLEINKTIPFRDDIYTLACNSVLAIDNLTLSFELLDNHSVAYCRNDIVESFFSFLAAYNNFISVCNRLTSHMNYQNIEEVSENEKL